MGGGARRTIECWGLQFWNRSYRSSAIHGHGPRPTRCWLGGPLSECLVLGQQLKGWVFSVRVQGLDQKPIVVVDTYSPYIGWHSLREFKKAGFGWIMLLVNTFCTRRLSAGNIVRTVLGFILRKPPSCL